jgi:SAM-dependent methyltransferase
MEGLFDQWHVYSIILARNFMRHAQISTQVRARLTKDQSLACVVDLGCGDGTMARECLRDIGVGLYIGVDLSGDALNRLTLQPPPGLTASSTRVETHCADMLEVLGNMPARSADLVLASFSLHHLNADQKHEVLQSVSDVLRNEGQFVWTDVAREPGHTRAQFLESLDGEIRLTWSSLSPLEIDRILAHIHEADFPEEEPWMRSAAQVVGLNSWECLYRDAYYGTWIMARSAE